VVEVIVQTEKNENLKKRRNNMFKIPEDMNSKRLEYESKNPREGTCGPTLIALLVNKTVKETIDNWSIPYRGYCSFRELEKELNKYKLKTEKIKAEAKYLYQIPEEGKIMIARIQWKRKYSRWIIPEKNTHFILLMNDNNNLILFDNTVGLFKAEDQIGKRYMKEGKITSYLKIL